METPSGATPSLGRLPDASFTWGIPIARYTGSYAVVIEQVGRRLLIYLGSL